MHETIDYIISFLLGAASDKNLCKKIGYTADREQFTNYNVVIVPSNFFSENVFGTPESMPKLPLEELEGTPILFGTPKIERIEHTIVCHADLVASTFFLISRYEELINPQRDLHNRFAAIDSLLYKIDCLQRPIVDEYGSILRNFLRKVGVTIADETQGFSGMYLTHDVDSIERYRHIRGFLGGIYRNFRNKNKLKMVFKAQENLKFDPFYTFPWLIKEDQKVPFSTSIFFFKAAKKHHKLDKPLYNLRSKDARQLIELCKKNRCQFGLHTSYYAGENHDAIRSEKRRLNNVLGENITLNRYHYLRTCSPNDMLALSQAGITDDFTMGFADVFGFRLGTCRAVRFIHPQTKMLTPLVLHPLSVMECTLMEERYMNMNYSQSLHKVKLLIDQIFKHNGEVVLLWHNTSMAGNCQNSYGKMYDKILKHINKLEFSADE